MILFRIIIAFHVISICYSLALEKSDYIEYFLPNHTIPVHYNIKLNLSLGPDYYYDGFVTITLNVLEKAKNITLHSDKENITKVYLTQGSEIVEVTHLNVNNENTFLSLELEKEIGPGEWNLCIEFTALYYENAGLMITWITEKNGENQPLLATHFQPVYARRMIPCFDEPRLKATFQLEVTYPEKFRATSNTDIKTSNSENGLITTIFRKTPKMSTYLLALAVTNFKANEVENFNTKFGIYAQEEQRNRSWFALNISAGGIEVFSKLLRVNYTLPKLDGVVFPSFGGGMENWGMILYGNMILETETERDLQFSVELICHELAHQWFGNLVTCEWWDFTWLNEGFATHYAPICADALLGNNSTRRFMYKHVIGLDNILSEDSGLKTRSLNSHVDHPYMTWRKFDMISYQKGSAIVRFMSLIFENFDKAISTYLNKNKYEAVTPEHLFEAIDLHARVPWGTNVSKIMKNWVEEDGYPLLTINITWENEVAIVVFEQERFTLEANPNAQSKKWWIPITLAIENSSYFDTVHIFDWMRDTDESTIIYIEDLPKEDWLISNIQAVTFCRVNYDIGNWKKIINYLKGPNFEKIHLLNRARLIDDANNLAKAFKLSEDIVLDLLSYLKQERDPLVLGVGKKALIMYSELLKNSKIYPKYVEFVRDVVGDAESKTILDDTNFDTILKKSLKTIFDGDDKSFEAINKLTNRIFTEEKLKKIQTMFSSVGRSAQSKQQKDFIDKLMNHFEINKKIRNNFFKGKNYHQVEQWLENRY